MALALRQLNPIHKKGHKIFFISKAFDRVWHAGRVHKVKSYGISGKIFGLTYYVFSH